MPYTIQQSFLKFKQDLEITSLQTSTVSTRQASVREAMEKELSVVDSFLTGSYSRSTMIAPLKQADIDIFIVLESKYFHHYDGQNGGQAGLLDLVKRALRRTYPDTPDISRSGQAVTINFTDFNVDVVPGFNRQGGGFLIPNSITQGWLSTNPKRHVEIMAEANKAHAGDLVPLIKMLKCWNRENSRHFRSFHLEVLALDVLNNVTITNFPSGVRFFFDKAREAVARQNPDPAGFGDDVGKYISGKEKIDEAVGKFQRAYDRAVRAEAHEQNEKVAEAVEVWRLIFGNYFPAYG
jgi:Second Messenger Oligonucleotide or Dinucleotide Synthetase domain